MISISRDIKIYFHHNELEKDWKSLKNFLPLIEEEIEDYSQLYFKYEKGNRWIELAELEKGMIFS